MKKVVLLVAALSLGCASVSARERGRQTAVVQKSAADGVGNSYLAYCEGVRKPKCEAEAEAYEQDHGEPNTRAERISCLRPCDSKTSTELRGYVDDLRAAQSILFIVLRKDDASDEEIAASQDQVRRSTEKLVGYIQRTGVVDTLAEAFGVPWKL